VTTTAAAAVPSIVEHMAAFANAGRFHHRIGPAVHVGPNATVYYPAWKMGPCRAKAMSAKLESV
jgi:hypothetical protein